MDDSTILGLFGLLLLAMILLPAGIFVLYRKLNENAGKKLDEEKRRFEKGEMSADERDRYIKRKIRVAEEMYHHGDLSLLELEAIKKQYTGKSNMLDYGGAAFTAAASNKIQAERAIAEHHKKAERALIFHATAGGAINGTAGAIIGAAASANKSAKEAAALEATRAAAENEYRKTLDDIAKRK